MAGIVVVAGEGKGTWTEVFRLLDSEQWSNAYVVTAPFFEEKFKERYKGKAAVTVITLDDTKSLPVLIKELSAVFSALTDDIALNLISGTGKQHMAVLAALLKAGVGIRLVSIGEKGLIEV
ncbi:hypothetical protein HY642_04295 [Candidatus Woesearchaeota archaeon]|nr:hypothetical protein [Candidatus Woesearchaeota archaeon]